MHLDVEVSPPTFVWDMIGLYIAEYQFAYFACRVTFSPVIFGLMANLNFSIVTFDPMTFGKDILSSDRHREMYVSAMHTQRWSQEACSATRLMVFHVTLLIYQAIYWSKDRSRKSLI